jgi:hypothetical protein
MKDEGQGRKEGGEGQDEERRRKDEGRGAREMMCIKCEETINWKEGGGRTKDEG